MLAHDDVENSLGGVAISKWIRPRGHRAIESRDHRLRVSVYQNIRADVDGFGPFRAIAYRHARYAEDTSFFLHTAGIRNNGRAIRKQIQEIRIANGLGPSQVRRQINLVFFENLLGPIVDRP